jgi:sn-glycerol 3-phosphate transport system permease protein
MLAPAAIVFIAFFFIPLVRLIEMGFHRPNAFGTSERYVGWSQYHDVVTGGDLAAGLRITGTYVLYTVPLGVVLGVALAVAAHRRLRGIKVFQAIFSSTIATSAAVASVVFLVLVNPQVGYFRDVSFLSLSNPDTALRGVALSSVWQNLGLTFVIVLAGLQAVPDDLLEAATLDGMGPVRRFLRVTVPMLSPTLLFLGVVLTILALQAFAPVDILTDGGPQDATQTLVYKVFAHQQPSQQGVGAVLALGLFVVTLAVTLAQFVLLERRVHYAD